MTNPPYLTNLADIARGAGLKVVESPGWKTRGHGGMGLIQTIACHHTAGPTAGNMPSLPVIRDGRSGLKGPLSHFGLGRDGTVYVVAAGLCYHAGVTHKASQGNYHAIGIEAEATGTARWPEAQLVAYAKLCAALCKAFDLPVSAVQGHKEIAKPTGRKSDPNFDMTNFRKRVKSVLEAPVAKPNLIADLDKVAKSHGIGLIGIARAAIREARARLKVKSPKAYAQLTVAARAIKNL